MQKILAKKAQEEIVGFVLIIVIVAVIGVVLLGISLRKPTIQKAETSERVGSFLKSIAYYTTDCQNPPTQFKNIEKLIKMCYEMDECSDNRPACEALSTTLKNIMNSSFLVKKGSYVQYYNLTVFVEEKSRESILKKDIIKPITAGNLSVCSMKLFNKREFFGFGEERLIIGLEVCYNIVD